MIGQYRERNAVRINLVPRVSHLPEKMRDPGNEVEFGCQQPLLLGGALRDSPKNGCEGD